MIKWILIAFIALLVLSHYGINLRDLVSSTTGQDNIGFVVTTIKDLWNNYLKGPVTDIFGMLWNQIILPLLTNR